MAERRPRPARRSAGEWQAIIQELAECRESLSDFCRREGIYPPTLRWWQWRLKGQAKIRRAAASHPMVPTFTEVQVVKTPVSPPSGTCFELRWRDGLTLVVPQEFDRQALCQLLAVLEGAGC